LRKVLLITWNDLRQTLSDKSLLLLMFVAPLAVATIISVSFGSMANENSPIDTIPIAVVNADRASPIADFGGNFVSILQSQSEEDGFLQIRLVDNAAEAESMVVAGEVSAAIILPEDLSRRLTGPATRGPAGVTVQTRPDRKISADIITNITRQVLDGFASGIAVSQAVVSTVASIEQVPAPAVLVRPSMQEFRDGEREPPGEIISVETRSRRFGGVGFNPLVAFGSTQAIFFALFTANANAASIMEEERDGTFIRLLASPTRKLTLLGGKLISTIVMVVVQLVLLFIAFTIIGSLLEGQLLFIWGTKIGLILLVILLTAIAASGLGAVVASASTSPEQASAVGTVINMFMAVTGGAFGFRFASGIRYASAVYWGSNAFEELAGGGSAIWSNVMVLGAFGIGAFMIAVLLLQRRFDR
jgi:ABC-2 type transport system permease protein